MKSLLATLLLALAVVSPSMASELNDKLVAMEKSLWKAWGNHDVKAFTAAMTDDAVQVSASGNVLRSRETVAAEIRSHRCTLNSVDLSETSLRQPSPDTAILTYIATQDATCDGEKLPNQVFATVIYVRQGDQWRWTHYQETALE